MVKYTFHELVDPLGGTQFCLKYYEDEDSGGVPVYSTLLLNDVWSCFDSALLMYHELDTGCCAYERLALEELQDLCERHEIVVEIMYAEEDA